MRKRIIGSRANMGETETSDTWLDLEQIATVEVTSEDPAFPIEGVFHSGDGPGWRAAEEGQQLLRIIFDTPMRLQRLHLHFVENEIERTQEFTIRWSPAQGGPTREIVRQQWTFSPAGSTSEVERYEVDLDGVAALELVITPDVSSRSSNATLKKWLIG